jgi:hypothetical protein
MINSFDHQNINFPMQLGSSDANLSLNSMQTAQKKTDSECKILLAALVCRNLIHDEAKAASRRSCPEHPGQKTSILP